MTCNFGEKLVQDLAGNAFQTNCFSVVALSTFFALAIAAAAAPPPAPKDDQMPGANKAPAFMSMLGGDSEGQGSDSDSD